MSRHLNARFLSRWIDYSAPSQRIAGGFGDRSASNFMPFGRVLGAIVRLLVIAAAHIEMRRATAPRGLHRSAQVLVGRLLAFRFVRGRDFVMNDAHIDHIGDKQGILCPFNSSGSGVILTVGIPAAGRPRSGRVGGTKSDDSTGEIDVGPENLRWISKVRNNDCVILCTGLRRSIGSRMRWRRNGVRFLARACWGGYGWIA